MLSMSSDGKELSRSVRRRVIDVDKAEPSCNAEFEIDKSA
jgi:hypothetical protein